MATMTGPDGMLPREEHDEYDAIAYHLIIAEFDRLWAQPPNPADRRRMDQMITVIEAFEKSVTRRGRACLS